MNPTLEFLTEIFHQGLEYKANCSYRSAVSAYHDSIDSFSVGKHPRISSLLTGIFNNRTPQPRYFFMLDVEKVLGFLNSLDSERIKYKMLTYKVTMSLALIGSSRSHEVS